MIPMVIMVNDLGQDILKGLVGSFCLSVSLWVVYCSLDVLDFVFLIQDLMKFIDEFHSSVCGYF